MNDELKKELSLLSLEEKKEVRDYLSQSIAQSRMGMHRDGRAEFLLDTISGLIGHPVSLLDRRPMDVWARTMVAYQMILEGYTTPEIGRQMRKDHSTVIHYKWKMKDALDLPQAYRDILPLWNDFKETIQ